MSNISAIPYDSYFNYLFDELRKLDTILEAAFHQKNAGHERNKFFTTDLYISPDYIASLFSQEKKKNGLVPGLEKRLAEIDREICSRLEKTQKTAGSFPLDYCTRLFSLSEQEKLVLLLAFAPHVDSKYEKIFSYFHDALDLKLPSAGLVYDLFFTLYGGESATSVFDEENSLLYWNLISFGEEGASLPVSRTFFIEPAMAGFLLAGKISLPEKFHLFEEPPFSWEALAVSQKTFERLQNVSEYLQAPEEKEEALLISFSGTGELAKFKSACALANDAGLSLIEIDTGALLTQGRPFGFYLRTAVRAAVLTGSALFFKKAGLAEQKDSTRFFESFIEEFLRYNIPVFLSSGEFADIPREHGSRFHDIFFDVPDFEMRKRVWTGVNEALGSFPEEIVHDLAGSFEFTEEQILGAFEHARKRSLGGGDEQIKLEDLLEGCRFQSQGKLGSLGVKLESSYRISDVVLPGELYEQISEIIYHSRFKRQVYDTWGFGKKVAYGRGISVLFSGPSGTGKTMMASALGNELKLDVYKIDLSSVVSKYIGETEKNLSRIFREAATSNAVLFFDEADAIFGKRTEVKNSHDRYANIEVSYLLQKMEEYEGITILASNFRQNIDEAFLRRMQFVMEFPFPDKKDREKIWQTMFPSEAPVSDEINFDFLADKLDVTGGNIKNMAVSAAFIASGEEEPIGMRHVLLAAKREYKKLNKSFLEHDFSPYYELIGSKNSTKKKVG